MKWKPMKNTPTAIFFDFGNIQYQPKWLGVIDKVSETPSSRSKLIITLLIPVKKDQKKMDITSFYSHKNLFLTGASGFLGICLLEKILRSIPDHGKIYLLLRAKCNKTIDERLNDIKNNRIFDQLRQQKAIDDVFHNVYAINGDVGIDNLNINEHDLNILIDDVNIIIHSAATLDFGDTLKQTINVNLLGTKRCLDLAKKCHNLNCFVHVSSAYVNAFKLKTEEILYDLPMETDKLIDLYNKLSDDELIKRTPELLGYHLNTYTITKHMAEHEVKKCEHLFPCSIVRPSMIVGAWHEPVPGWTISKNGPQGFMMAASKGVIRRLPVAIELIYDYIPVDIVVNTILVTGCYVGTNGKFQIFHCTSSTRNPFRWMTVESRVNSNLTKYPLKSAVWYPHLKFLPSILWYKISAIFVHILPAIFLDTVTKLTGGRPILMKLHRNVNTSLNRLEKFIFTEWHFDAKNTISLYRQLSINDQQSFNIDISNLLWIDYFEQLSLGSRVYLNNEPLTNLKAAKIKHNILLLVHWIFQILVFSFVWYLTACLLGTTMSKSVFVLPILYILMSLL